MKCNVVADRELLEEAAKAAGIEFGSWFDDGHKRGLLAGRMGRAVWNPLTDDGDALRLAVKLKIYIQQHPENQFRACSVASGYYFEDYAEHDGDEMAATRRAIVRAAAAIAATKEGAA